MLDQEAPAWCFSTGCQAPSTLRSISCKAVPRIQAKPAGCLRPNSTNKSGMRTETPKADVQTPLSSGFRQPARDLLAPSPSALSLCFFPHIEVAPSHFHMCPARGVAPSTSRSPPHMTPRSSGLEPCLYFIGPLSLFFPWTPRPWSARAPRKAEHMSTHQPHSRKLKGR